MRDWKDMSLEEKKAVKGGTGSYFANKEKMEACIRKTTALLEGNPRAIALAWKIAWGCYLVNTPEEIAAYCIEQAKADENRK